MPLKTHHYSRAELAVIWKPYLCIHSAICVKGLGKVFNTKQQPWIDLNNATKDQIIEQVKKCPSGALSFIINEQGK